jgi:hypothetical protein
MGHAGALSRNSAAGEHSARHIRRIVRSCLDEWEMAELSDAVELGVTELVASVVPHVPDRRCALLRQSAGVRVEVADDSPQLPVVPTGLSWESEGGRGLVLLDAMAAKWGVWPEAGGGKTVWFECRGDDSG